MSHAAYSRDESRYDPKDLEEEVLLCDRSSGRVVVLNVSAREIYLLCDGKRSPEEIALALASTFGVDAETARRDVSEVLPRLRDLGAIVPA